MIGETGALEFAKQICKHVNGYDQQCAAPLNRDRVEKMVETLASFCDDMGRSPQDLSQDTVPACINETLGMSTEGSVLLWLLNGQPDEGGKVL